MRYWILSFTDGWCFMGAVALKTEAEPDAGGTQEALRQASLLGYRRSTYDTKLYWMPPPVRPIPESRLGVTLPTHASVAEFEKEFWLP